MTIFFLCPKPDVPSGGVFLIHRLVQLLNEAGKPAKVIRARPFDVFWDANPIPESMTGGLKDLVGGGTLVVPEVLWPPMHFDGRKIIFVQNYIWLSQDSSPFANGAAEVLVCSRFLANHMKRLYHANVIGKVTPFLDPGVWLSPNDLPYGKDSNRVLVMARRNKYWPKLVYALEAEGFPLEIVEKPVTQHELAEKLSHCEFYAHLTAPEGFPMACLEAMRAGTIVVGTTGGGGNEFMFNGETAAVVNDPATGGYGAEDFVRGIMIKLIHLREDAELRNKLWILAHTWSQRYTAAATTKELLEIFK